jgi:hypothetical protein
VRKNCNYSKNPPSLTRERAKALGKKGGLRSGISRNLKNLWKNALTKVGFEKVTVGGREISRLEAESIKMHNLILQGSVQAFLAVRDTMGERPGERLANGDGEDSPVPPISSSELLEILERRRNRMDGPTQ